MSAASYATRPVLKNFSLPKNRPIKADIFGQAVSRTKSPDKQDDNDSEDDVPPAEAKRHIRFHPMYKNNTRKLFKKILDH